MHDFRCNDTKMLVVTKRNSILCFFLTDYEASNDNEHEKSKQHISRKNKCHMEKLQICLSTVLFSFWNDSTWLIKKWT